MLTFSFFLATIALLLQSVSLITVPICAYLPWIGLIILQDRLEKRIWKPLWLSAIAGIVSDLLSDHPLGLHPIAYTMTTLALWQYRNRFLYNNPFHFALFTAIASILSSFLQIFFLFLFDKHLGIPPRWIAIDIISMAIFNGIYALAWFSMPLAAMAKFGKIINPLLKFKIGKIEIWRS